MCLNNLSGSSGPSKGVDGIKSLRMTSYKAFLLIWFGQLVSLTGSGLTGFAIGVWVFLRTGSTTAFALIQLFSSLPTILVGPIAGAIVDRCDRRHAMLLSDFGAALCTLTILILISVEKLEMWHLYLLLAISASFSTFQWPAYSAAITLLVPKGQLGRANGMVQIAEGVAQILAPVTASVLVGLIMIEGVMMIDLATFVFAFATLFIVSVPKPKNTEEGQLGKGTIFTEASYGWRYIGNRRGLFGLLIFFAAINFVTSIATVLFTPLILGFSTVPVLGLVVSIAGLGYLCGSIVMSIWGGPKRKILGIYAAELLVAASLFLLGSTMNVVLLGIGAFAAFFSIPVLQTCSQVIWQRKTAPDIQGRVFSYRRVISYSSIPVAYLLAGPLVDDVFNPLLIEGRPLAGSIGRLIGVGPGRGTGLIYIIEGVLVLILTCIAFLYPRIRRIEDELPDMIQEVQSSAPDQLI